MLATSRLAGAARHKIFVPAHPPRGDKISCSIRCVSQCSDERVQQFPSVPDGKRSETECARCRRSVMAVMQIHAQFADFADMST